MGVATGKRILVVEDDANLGRGLQIALQKTGYDVALARDGAEAIHLWRAQEADLVITDLYMPEKNGIEIIIELRSHSPRTPIIAMSGGGKLKHVEILADAEMLGAVLTIEKPFTMADMLALVERALKAEAEPT